VTRTTGQQADSGGPAPGGRAAPDNPARSQVAETVVAALRSAGCDLIFGVPGGGSNLDVVGAAEAAGCRFILTHTETAAAIMAGVAAELTGTPSACVVTQGPGAASAVNGIAQALLDRQPVVVISDCVPRVDETRVSHQRLDHQAMFAPVTKASVRIASPSDGLAEQLVALACEGRPGPVHLDIDPTASGATSASPASDSRWASPPADRRANSPGTHAGAHTQAQSVVSAPGWESVDSEIRDIVRFARRPVMVAGVGAVALPADQRAPLQAALARFLDRTRLPVLTTYKGRGIVDDRGPFAAGVVTGATIEAPLLEEADLIVGLGFDPVELIPAPWPYAAPMITLGPWPIDDSTYFGDRVLVELVGPLDANLDGLTQFVTTSWRGSEAQRHRRRALHRIEAARPAQSEHAAGMVPQDVVSIARALAPEGAIATVDSGAHMLPAVPMWEAAHPDELLISSGLATMGFALPAAVAAALVHPERRVICFTGDGGLGMALAELETLARLDLPVVVVLFNDSALSLIAAKQKDEGHGGARAVRYAPINFAAVAAGCGLYVERAVDAASYRRAMEHALTRPGPTLIDVAVDPSAYPAILNAIRGDPSSETGG
jgi:acetolactate synthase I/II/III large subunit